MKEIIKTPAAPNPIGPYSQAICANGFIFVSGQIPVQPGTGLVVGKDIVAQTRQVMVNLSAILKAAGSDINRVVKTTIFLSNLDDFSRFNQIYEEYFMEAKPARAAVQVAGLPKDVLLEIEAIAIG